MAPFGISTSIIVVPADGVPQVGPPWLEEVSDEELLVALLVVVTEVAADEVVLVLMGVVWVETLVDDVAKELDDTCELEVALDTVGLGCIVVSPVVGPVVDVPPEGPLNNA